MVCCPQWGLRRLHRRWMARALPRRRCTSYLHTTGLMVVCVQGKIRSRRFLRRMVTFQQLLLQLLDEVVGLANAANDVLSGWPGSCLRGQAPPAPLTLHVA